MQRLIGKKKRYLWSVCGIRFSAFSREGVIGELRGVPAIESNIKFHVHQILNLSIWVFDIKYSGTYLLTQEINKLKSLCRLCVLTFHVNTKKSKQSMKCNKSTRKLNFNFPFLLWVKFCWISHRIASVRPHTVVGVRIYVKTIKYYIIYLYLIWMQDIWQDYITADTRTSPDL